MVARLARALPSELIGDPDVLIAATAMYHNLTLVTQNQRHFQRIAGLAIYQ